MSIELCSNLGLEQMNPFASFFDETSTLREVREGHKAKDDY